LSATLMEMVGSPATVTRVRPHIFCASVSTGACCVTGAAWPFTMVIAGCAAVVWAATV
jgi:hypothetical protein